MSAAISKQVISRYTVSIFTRQKDRHTTNILLGVTLPSSRPGISPLQSVFSIAL
jgi:hypothetical protein